MIFKHTWEQVLAGMKTQTSRIVKDSQEWYYYAYDDFAIVQKDSRRDLWRLGNDYAVQPARGQKAVGRIRITDIRLMDVRKFTDADILAEGFDSRYAFMKVWVQMHDKNFAKPLKRRFEKQHGIPRLTWEDFLSWRPAELYTAWVLTFELVDFTGKTLYEGHPAFDIEEVE